MAIDQDQINLLLDVAEPSDSSDRVFFIEKGNMMTAINYFKKITGEALSLQQLTSRKASGGFYLYTHKGRIGQKDVNVTVRGGSSSSVTSVRDVYIFTKDYQLLGHHSAETTTPGVPTLDITNPGALGQVPRIVTCEGRVEFKFTTRYEYVSNR